MENMSDIKESVYDVVIYQTQMGQDTINEVSLIPIACKYEISCDLAEEYDIELEMEDMEEVTNVGELITLVESKINEKDDNG